MSCSTKPSTSWSRVSGRSSPTRGAVLRRAARTAVGCGARRACGARRFAAVRGGSPAGAVVGVRTHPIRGSRTPAALFCVGVGSRPGVIPGAERVLCSGVARASARWQFRAIPPARWQFCAVLARFFARICHFGAGDAQVCHLGVGNARGCHLAHAWPRRTSDPDAAPPRPRRRPAVSRTSRPCNTW
jgi:hypothetical protein